MKHILTIFIFFISSILISAQQQYKPCLDGEMTRWSFIAYHAWDAPLSSRDIIAYGDTLLNGIMYKLLYIDDSFDPYNAEESNTNWKNHVSMVSWQWEYFYIRESEDASKLYIYSSRWEKEYLISDISLQEGENFQLSNNYFGTREAVVDTVYFKNGLKHIQWYLTDDGVYYMEPFTFIESVGSDVWFIYPNTATCKGLNCFQNQTTFYKNERTIDNWNFADFPCGYRGEYWNINSISNDNYHVFIQKDKLEILFASNANVDISIYDMQGKLCYAEDNISGQKIIIPTTSFFNGVYILKIFNRENYQTNSNKIILQ